MRRWRKGRVRGTSTIGGSDTEEFFDASGGVVRPRLAKPARGRTSGVPVESLMWFDLQIVRGRVARLDVHPDPAKALEAAGPSEQGVTPRPRSREKPVPPVYL